MTLDFIVVRIEGYLLVGIFPVFWNSSKYARRIGLSFLDSPDFVEGDSLKCMFWSEYLVRLGITLLPSGQMDGNSDKTTSLHPTLPPFSAVVLSFCSSDETGLSKWPERNNTYFIREVGTARMHQSGREGRPRPRVGELVMGQCGVQWSA